MLVMALALATMQGDASAPPSAGRDWWFFGQMAQPAPDRRVVFIDHNSRARQGDVASLRALMVFEAVQDGAIRAFEVTYEFRCAARQERVRDALFTLADGSAQPGYGPPDPWSATAVASGTELLMRAACDDRQPPEARHIDGTPLAEAARLFGRR